MKYQKLMKVLSSIVLMCVCSAASAGIVNGEYPFTYLDKNRLCEGVKPRVMEVTTVGATRSGGCCGTDEIWSQGQRFPLRPQPLDAIGDVARYLQGYDYAKLHVDKSIVPVIDPVVSIMEQMSIRNATIEVCMNRFDMLHVHQNKADGTVVKLGLGYNVYLNMDTDQGRTKMLVQQLSGETVAKSVFYEIYYNFNPREEGLVVNSWPKVTGTFANFLTTVPNAEAQTNLDAIKAELGGLLGF